MPKGINNITMGQQHNSFKKDIDMLSEAYGHMYNKEIVEEGMAGAGLGGAAGALLGGPIGAGLGAAAGHAMRARFEDMRDYEEHGN